MTSGLWIRTVTTTLLFLATFLLGSDSLLGRIVKVTDGDTVTLLVERQEIKIRLKAIDAPERGQDFGQKSKEALAELVFGKDVRIETHGQDRYGRMIGDVYVGKTFVNEGRGRLGVELREILEVAATRRSRKAGSCGEEGPLGRKVARRPLGLPGRKGPATEREKAAEAGQIIQPKGCAKTTANGSGGPAAIRELADVANG
jgi:hypothetical protein